VGLVTEFLADPAVDRVRFLEQALAAQRAQAVKVLQAVLVQSFLV
jgi:hypothetical protein